jgi:hypothetical protein
MNKFEHNNKPAKQVQPAFAIAMDYRFEPNTIGVSIM